MSKKMKAVVIEAPNVYSVKKVNIPSPSHGEVLVAIRSVAICGSDPGIISGKVLNNGWPPYYPFIAGHEFSGEVVKLGTGVTDLVIGDRVSGEAHCGCSFCRNCKSGNYNLCLNYGNIEAGHRHYGHNTPGCYAQYQVYSQNALTKMPGSISFDEGALVDTAGTAYNAILSCGVVPGGYTVIIGPGPMGISSMLIAKALGSKIIVIGRRERLDLAKKLGADYIVNYEKINDVVSEVMNITNNIGADQVIEAAGNTTAFLQSIQMAKKGGHVAFISIPPKDGQLIAGKHLIMNQITLHGIRANPNCSQPILSMMSSGILSNLKMMITHVFSIDDIEIAFDIFAKRKDGAVKVLIHPFE